MQQKNLEQMEKICHSIVNKNEPISLANFFPISSRFDFYMWKKKNLTTFIWCLYFFLLRIFFCFRPLFCLLITWFLPLKLYAHIFGARYFHWIPNIAHTYRCWFRTCAIESTQHSSMLNSVCEPNIYVCQVDDFGIYSEWMDGNEFALNFRGPSEFPELNFKLTAL